MALFKESQKESKEAAGAMQYAAGSALEMASKQRATLLSAEMAKLGVFGALGSPGSWDAPLPGQWTPPGFDVFNTSGEGLSSADKNLSGSMTYSTGGGPLLNTPREGIIDPEKYTKNIMASSSFRTQSMRTAEVEQMLRGEGEEYNKLYNSSLGLISQQYAQMQRNATRELTTDFASNRGRGATGHGSRNINWETAHRMSVNEGLMREKANAMFDAAQKNFYNIRTEATKMQQNNQAWLENLPLIGKSHIDALQTTADTYITASKVAGELAYRGFLVKMSQQPTDFGKKLAEGLIKMVAGPIVGSALGLQSPGDWLGQIAESAVSGVTGPKKPMTGLGGVLPNAMDKLSNYAADYMDRDNPVQGPATAAGEAPEANLDAYGGVAGAAARGNVWLKGLFGADK